MITKEQFDKSYIVNDYGVLRDKYLKLASSFGYTIAESGYEDEVLFKGSFKIIQQWSTLASFKYSHFNKYVNRNELTLEDFNEEGGEEFIPTLDEPCEVSRADDLETWFKFIPRAKYVPHYLKEECYVGDFQSRDVSWRVSQISTEHFVFRPIKVKKTWQDVAQEFIKNDPVLSVDKFVEDIFGDDFTEYHEPMKQLAKLIVEKSGD